MIYTDPIYGKVSITDKVVIELIKSPSVQRLKNIDIAGYSKPHYPVIYNRFEHSMGVYLLLKKFKAPILEQIAGLLHDVSHTAFSHCVDYAIAEGCEKTQSHQDNIFNDFVLRSELPAILKKHKIDIDYILDDSNFPLKETELPNLCADRIDYVLGGALRYKSFTLKEVKDILKSLNVIDNKWVFKDQKSAQKMADLFYEMNVEHYAGFKSALMFRTTGDFLKYAISKKYISKKDLSLTDNDVIEKIIPNLKKDKKLKKLWERMNKNTNCQESIDNQGAHVFCKSRVIDPLFIEDGKILKLSEKNPDWKEVVKIECEPKEYFLEFLD